MKGWIRPVRRRAGWIEEGSRVAAHYRVATVQRRRNHNSNSSGRLEPSLTPPRSHPSQSIHNGCLQVLARAPEQEAVGCPPIPSPSPVSIIGMRGGGMWCSSSQSVRGRAVQRDGQQRRGSGQWDPSPSATICRQRVAGWQEGRLQMALLL